MIIQSKPYQDRFLEKSHGQNSRNLPHISSSKNNPPASSDVNFSGGFFKKRIYTSKPFKKFAKMTANPILLEATTVLGLSCLLRPLTIMAMPKAEKRDKEYASAHSIVSGLWSYGTTLLLYNPINSAVKNVSKRLKEDPNYLKGSFVHKNEKTKNAFEFVANTLPKVFLHPLLGAGIIALIPVAMKILFPKDSVDEKTKQISNNNAKKQTQPQFKGKMPSAEDSKGFFGRLMQKIEKKIEPYVEKLAYNKHAQRYSEKMANSSKDKSAFLKQAINTTTAFLGTLVYIGTTLINPKIEEDRKKTLSTNYLITWGLSAIGAVALNKSVMKSFEKISNNYKKYNIQELEETFEKKLALTPHKTKELLEEKAKELEKIEFFRGKMADNAATMICFAVMYRYITPVLATPLAELSKKLFPQESKKSAKT